MRIAKLDVHEASSRIHAELQEDGTEPGHGLEPFLEPESVAVIGATERTGSWGSVTMEGLLGSKYPGRIYPVNRHAKSVYGIPAFPDVSSIPHCPELAILTIPEDSVEGVVRVCGEKGIRGITIITAGFGEVAKNGRTREDAIARIAKSYGMRILGPNVSGSFNLHKRFNATRSPSTHLIATPLAGISQGGYVFSDVLALGYARGMGVGKFVHTGNECDLQVTDFLDHFGEDPEVKGIIMYLETLRNGRHFLEVARHVATKKPIVVHKAGRTEGGSRAALSHTGAMTGHGRVYQGAFHQINIVQCPTMELLLPLGHALIERPPMRGNRVAIVTMGGSWGVALTDRLEEEGLKVPELSPALQRELGDLGIPARASVRNPVDIGATGFVQLSVESLVDMGRKMLSSGEVDALIFHGLGRPGVAGEKTHAGRKFFLQMEKEVMTGYDRLQTETGRPVIIGSTLSPWESQAVHDLNQVGVRIHHRVDEIALILSLMHGYWRRLQKGNLG